MKKIVSIILISFIFLGSAGFALAQDDAQEDTIELYYFYGSTCPVCKKVSSLLDNFKKEYPSLKINSYEVFGDRKNAKFFLQLLE